MTQVDPMKFSHGAFAGVIWGKQTQGSELAGHEPGAADSLAITMRSEEAKE